MQLPDDFIQLVRPVFGEERFEHFVKVLDEESPVSIRVNPRKVPYILPRLGQNIVLPNPSEQPETAKKAVPWCRNGYYLPTRPNFTFDPLLHAGCYYVQEASSMFLDEVLRQHLPTHPVMALDLCAAPGGKSTLMRSALLEGSTLYSNEPNRKRASILLENVVKWGYDRHFVTRCYPKDYRKSKLRFDLILCDVPCSGEGMFRKDPDSVKEWSLQNVAHCQQLQREIVSDAWQCLNDGGLFIYSTCTYNTKEDEENVRWMIEELGAEPLAVETQEKWGITGSLLKGFNVPVYRFIPGYTRGEGLFMAVMRKESGERRERPLPTSPKRGGERGEWKEESGERRDCTRGKNLYASKSNLSPLSPLLSPLNEKVPSFSADYRTAISYLRGEALTLPPDTPRGLIEITFMGHPLGLVKNIGNRANNLYPKEWRIKSTYVPDEYQPVLLT